MENRIVDVIEFACDFTDFAENEDKVREWQIAYFHLLSWKNTWGLTWEMDILSYRNHCPFVRFVCEDKKHTEENVLDMLESYGYRNVKVQKYKARIFDPLWEDEYDNDFENGIMGYYLE